MDEERVESKADDSAERARVFRRNFRASVARSGFALRELATKSGVPESTLRRWNRAGTTKPSHSHLEQVGRALGLIDPWALFLADPGEDEVRREIDRATNRAVERVRKDRPELFRDFSPDDWDEIYSQHGTGGPLTYDGAVDASVKINQKRELRRKFEALLETHHLPTLAALIELMYEESSLARHIRPA